MQWQYHCILLTFLYIFFCLDGHIVNDFSSNFSKKKHRTRDEFHSSSTQWKLYCVKIVLPSPLFIILFSECRLFIYCCYCCIASTSILFYFCPFDIVFQVKFHLTFSFRLQIFLWIVTVPKGRLFPNFEHIQRNIDKKLSCISCTYNNSEQVIKIHEWIVLSNFI